MIPWACCYLAGQTHPRHLNLVTSLPLQPNKEKEQKKEDGEGSEEKMHRQPLAWARREAWFGMEHGGYRAHWVFKRLQGSILHEGVCMGGKGVEGSRANPDTCRDGKVSRRQLMKKKWMDMKIRHYVLWVTCILVHRKSQPFLKKNVRLNYATSCVKKKKQQNPKGLPCLKTGYTLSVRPEANGAHRESKLGKQSWQRDISVLQGTTCKIFWDFFSIVIWKRFGKGSEMKTAFSHQSNAAFARGSDNRFQNKPFGITRVRSSHLPSRRQQTDDYRNQHQKYWQAAAPKILNTAQSVGHQSYSELYG